MLEDFAEDCGLELEPFQRRILRAVASGTREIVTLLPRGNGKTALMALVAVHHLVSAPNARVVAAAASRDQTNHLFAYAERYARTLDEPDIVFRWPCVLRSNFSTGSGVDSGLAASAVCSSKRLVLARSASGCYCS